MKEKRNQRFRDALKATGIKPRKKLTTIEVAMLAQVSASAVRRAIERGVLKAWRRAPGSAFEVDLADAIAYVQGEIVGVAK